MEGRAGLAQLLDQMRSAHDEAEYLNADARFHLAIGVLAGPVHFVLQNRLLTAAASIAPLLARPDARACRGLPEHEAIYDAIALEDPAGAMAAMAKHLRTISRYAHDLRG